MLVAVLGEGQKTARVQSGQERVSAVERGDGIVHRLIGTSCEIAQQQNLAHREFGMGNAKMVLGCPVNTAHRPKLRVVQIRGDLLFLWREPEEHEKNQPANGLARGECSGQGSRQPGRFIERVIGRYQPGYLRAIGRDGRHGEGAVQRAVIADTSKNTDDQQNSGGQSKNMSGRKGHPHSGRKV